MEPDSTYYIDLISRHLAGECTEAEQQELVVWINNSSENKELFAQYRNAWLLVDAMNIELNTDTNKEWENFKSKKSFSNPAIEKEDAKIISIAPQKNKAKLFMSIAASILVLVGLAALYLIFSGRPEMKNLEAFNTNIESKLPDGSIISLKKNATLQYPETFEGNERLVKLKGEAYFQVTPDKQKPFIIETKNVMIEVVGTKFYVNATDENKEVEVIVNEGTVAVYYKINPEDKILVTAGEKAELSSETITPGIKENNTDKNFIAWKTHQMSFENEKLIDICNTLEDVYDCKIRIKNKALNNCTVTASFDNQSLESVLKVLEATVNIKISKKGSYIEITGNSCQ